jgi:hypothetical protein
MEFYRNILRNHSSQTKPQTVKTSGSLGIAPAAVFFAADDSKSITRETLLISGGLR